MATTKRVYWDACAWIALLVVYGAVFGATVVIAGAAYGFMFNKLDRVEDSLARVETKLNEIANDTRQTRADIGEVKLALTSPPGEAEAQLLAKFRDVLGPNVVPAGGGTAALATQYGTVADLVRGLPPERRKELEIGCMFAEDMPAQYSTTL